MRGKVLQWHLGFYAALQAEFGEETDKLSFGND